MPNPFMVIGANLAGQIGGGGGQATGGIGGGLGQISNAVCPTGLVDMQQGIQLSATGFVDPASFSEFARLQGMRGYELQPGDYIVSTWNGVERMADIWWENIDVEMHINDRAKQILRYVPSIHEATFLFNRRLISPRLFNHYLWVNTSGEPGLQRAWNEARFEIPGPSDLIRFAVRDAFTPQAVQAFEYHKEFPIEIVPWMEKQGYGQSTGIAIPPGATTTIGVDQRTAATWMDLYWWSHWELVSPTQAFEMYHRFYRNSRYGPSPEYKPDIEFELPQLELLLKTADYPTYWRKRLAAISYSPLTRVDVRRMYDIDVLDDAGVYHAYRAIGYNDENANRLLLFTKRLKENKAKKAFKYITLQDLQFVSENKLMDRLEIIKRLIEIGHSEDQALLIIKGWELKNRIKEVKRTMTLIHQAFMDGLFSENASIQLLLGLGLPADRSTEIMRQWKQDRLVNRRYLSAQQAMEMAVNGIVNEEALREKLSNLNYGEEEIEAMVIRVQQKINQQLSKLFEKQLREQQRQEKLAIDTLLKPYTDKFIVKWFKQGLIDLRDVLRILRLRQWKTPAINNWIISELEIDQSVIDSTSEEMENETETEMEAEGIEEDETDNR